MNKTEKTIAVVTMLADTFRQPLGDGAFEGYRIGLEDLTEEQIAVAAARAVRESKFMPSPAELRAFAGVGGPRVIEQAAAESWEAVRTAMDRHDYTTSVDFGPLVNAVVRNLGGWQWLCDQKLTSMPFVRKDFERVFGLFSATQVESLQGEPLRGTLGGVAMRIQIGKQPLRPALPAREERSAGDVRRLVGEIVEARNGR